MSVAAVASSPEVGSSMKSRLGFATSSTPIFTLLRWPPLMPLLSTEPTKECYIRALSSEQILLLARKGCMSNESDLALCGAAP